ncbi:glycosyltransferase family 4 protein [Sphingomonas sabuli]|uniref:glycosyltransferase family 4 protein n=1 Tax=Sphingomonas sabuli TaxID=2764186 RepID=UPI001FE5FF3E|nr:glycosyltransferase family 4 protein [Sphingomonas sabuli]
MPNRKILVVGSYAPSLVTFRGPLIAAMVQLGHDVVAAAPDMDDATAGKLRALGASPANVPLKNASLSPFGLLRSLRAMRALVRSVRPDAILSYTVKPVVLGALAGHAERVPKIVSLVTGLGYAFTGGREPKRMVSKAAASFLYRAAFRRSHVILFQNGDDQALFRKLGLVGRDRQTHVVDGSGIDIDQFTPAPLPEGPSFLMIARLLRDKGICEFGQAAMRIKATHPDVPIALVGMFDPSPDSLSQDELDALIAAGIDYRGQLADVRPAIAQCSVYVLPSYREGTPRSVLEAMAMGRAIITTDAPGCRETVVDGENGLLVPPRDADALYEAMLTMIERPEPIAAMGAASRRIAERKYDVRKVNADLLRYAGLDGDAA